ncbi:hypothetical protein GC176_20340 [bacterium]|nr:hypothetical protein [bacterium]
MINALYNDDCGFVVSAELALIVTLIFTAVAVGIAVVRDAMVMELNDVSEMVGAVSQSYNIVGLRKPRNDGKYHAQCSGSGFNDNQDACDGQPIILTHVCGKNDPSCTGRPESSS